MPTAYRRTAPVACPTSAVAPEADEQERAAVLRRKRTTAAPAPEKNPPSATGLAASEHLVRQLVQATNQTPPSGSPVLLDTEVDGVRCVLMRREPLATNQTLSPREQEIARMIAKGLPNKTIAAVLDISSWTVGTYLRRIFAKLNVSSRAAMVAKLSEMGLLDASAR
jgi:DNA-binding CsgD family transcriptional regulator